MNGHICTQRPQPLQRLASTNAWPRSLLFGPRASALKPMPGQPISVMHFLQPVHASASTCAGAPAVLGWATGELPEPPNNPQVGMANMRLVMPALQKAKPAALDAAAIDYQSIAVPAQKRDTRVVKDTPVEDIAREIIAWIESCRPMVIRVMFVSE